MSKLLNIFMLLLVLALICPASLPAQASTGSNSTLLQYIGGGHVLGFSEGEFYVAAGDHALKVEFVNGLAVRPVAESEGSRQNTAPLDKVTYNGIWKDTDIVYTSAKDGIAESTYYLNTPASAENIRLRYNRPVSLDEQGNLVISFEHGNLVDSAPVAWQEIAGQRMGVRANYVIYGEREIGFALAGCRPGVAVTIDPTLSWNTFLGSNQDDIGRAIAVDGAGNIYVTGTSEATWGNPLRAYSSGDDAFVARLNSSGVLQWNTFLGGTGNDLGNDITLDGSGNICVAGTSNETWGNPPVMKSGHGIAFAAKLNSNGTLLWNSFLGDSGWDFGEGIAADEEGNVYVTGYSFATWGPSPKRDFSHEPDAFAAKLDSSGNLTWNTFLGGTGSDYAHGITTDSAWNVYVSGYSDAAWGESPVRLFTPSELCKDGFAVKLNSSGILQWNTFLGGSGNDYCFSIAVDAAGNSYVAGSSNVAWGDHPVQAYTADGDGFAAKLDGNGNLTWNTFLGGSGGDMCNYVAADASGIYIAGQSDATWGSPVRPFTADTDGFAAKLTNGGSLSWNTFLGGAGDDVGNGVAVDAAANVYVAGISDATWGSPVRAFTYGMSSPPEPHPTSDAFVAKILGNAPAITSFTPASGDSGTVVTINGRNFIGATVVSFGGTPAKSFTVNSGSKITATTDYGTSGKINVTTPAGTAVSASNFYFESEFSTDPNGSPSVPGGTAAPPQSPVILPTVSVMSASLSASRVAPGTPVTVSADVANTSTVNGSSSIKVYVNGEVESNRGVAVQSGSTMPVTFTVSRNEPGTYTVYVGGVSAGSFTVDELADSNVILYISMALIFIAVAGGAAYFTRRRQPGR